MYTPEINSFQTTLKPLVDSRAIRVAINALKDNLTAVSHTQTTQREKLISVEEVTAILGCCIKTISRLIGKKVLRKINYGICLTRHKKSDVWARINHDSREEVSDKK